MGGTPASWEDATPIYGIRYPKPNAPAVYLPDMFQHTGLDVEAALQAAAIPPANPAPVMVAASAAARDGYWTVPANDTERLALQNRGATTIRTDKGWTEQYFAAWSASNPGGTRSTPGWYPTANGPAFQIYGATAQALVSGWQQLTTAFNSATPDINTGGGAWASNGYTVPVSGLYRIDVSTSTGTVGAERVGAKVNRNSTAEATNNLVQVFATSPNGTAVSGLATLTGGDVIRAFVFATLASNTNTGLGSAPRLALEYVGHA